jgi:hypothetical protein
MSEQWQFNASQMFSYYPKYEYLDNLVSSSGRKSLNLYIDVKGCAQALFQEWAVKQIIYQSEGSRTVDTSLFSATMEFIAFHKLYAKKRQLDLNMYFFMESGESKYHLDIHPDYKADRHTGDFFDLDMAKKEFFHTILHKNYAVMEKVSNKIPNVYFIRLERLEADFIPWYLMKHCLPAEQVEAAIHIIYSMDKDMLQCMDAPNIFQFYRHYKSVKMLSHKDIFPHFLKCDDYNTDDPAMWFPMALSIIGDDGDGFKGVKGIGFKTLIKIFDDVKTLSGYSMDRVYENIRRGIPIFSKSYTPSNNALKKVLDNENIIIRNLKLASYQLLSDYVNGDYPSSVFAKRKQIHEIVNNTKKCSRAGILYSALQKVGQSGLISEQTLVNLF